MPDAWAMNASSGAPEYTAKELRLAFNGLTFHGVNDRFNARSGMFQAGPGAKLQLSGTTITVRNTTGSISPGATVDQGAYLVQIPSTTHTLTAANPSNPRKDIVVARVYDDDVDLSGQRAVVTEYIVGTPAGSPSEPPLPGGAVKLAVIDVPANNTAGSTLTETWPYTVANGGVLPTRSATELPAVPNESQYVDRQDLDQLMRYSGSAWQAVASSSTFNLAASMLGIQSGYASAAATCSSSSFVNLSGGPAVTATITASGRALVFWQCRADIADQFDTRLARMQVLMSGANAGVVGNSSLLGIRRGIGADSANSQSKMAFFPLTGLAAGSTTFTCQYASSTGNTDFDLRTLLVIPF